MTDTTTTLAARHIRLGLILIALAIAMFAVAYHVRTIMQHAQWQAENCHGTLNPAMGFFACD